MQLLLLAFALSMDSVALSIASGAKCVNLGFINIIKISFVFGIFQAIMPFLGFYLGLVFVEFVKNFDHFIIFIILSFLGVKMILQARDKDESYLDKINLRALILGALATSLDALAVGVGFSFIDLNILYACAIIGLVCFLFCILGCYIGKILGVFLEKKALILGGVILIFLGVKILLSHLLDHGFLA